MSASIEVAGEVTDELVEAIARLLPQLSSKAPPGAEQLSMIVADGDCTLLLARVDGSIVGALTLVVFRTPSGVKAWIEDVVVDEAARGHGVGEALNRAAIERARELAATAVNLTSRPSRQAANRLYQRLGFRQRDTNVYRYDL